MSLISYFVGKGERREVRLCGTVKRADGTIEQNSVFQSSDIRLASWVREQMMMMDDMVVVKIYLLDSADDDMWKLISLGEFNELLRQFRNSEHSDFQP